MSQLARATSTARPSPLGGAGHGHSHSVGCTRAAQPHADRFQGERVHSPRCGGRRRHLVPLTSLVPLAHGHQHLRARVWQHRRALSPPSLTRSPPPSRCGPRSRSAPHPRRPSHTAPSSRASRSTSRAPPSPTTSTTALTSSQPTPCATTSASSTTTTTRLPRPPQPLTSGPSGESLSSSEPFHWPPLTLVPRTARSFEHHPDLASGQSRILAPLDDFTSVQPGQEFPVTVQYNRPIEGASLSLCSATTSSPELTLAALLLLPHHLPHLRSHSTLARSLPRPRPHPRHLAQPRPLLVAHLVDHAPAANPGAPRVGAAGGRRRRRHGRGPARRRRSGQGGGRQRWGRGQVERRRWRASQEGRDVLVRDGRVRLLLSRLDSACGSLVTSAWPRAAALFGADRADAPSPCPQRHDRLLAQRRPARRERQDAPAPHGPHGQQHAPGALLLSPLLLLLFLERASH